MGVIPVGVVVSFGRTGLDSGIILSNPSNSMVVMVLGVSISLEFIICGWSFNSGLAVCTKKEDFDLAGDTTGFLSTNGMEIPWRSNYFLK